jgi:phosphoribosyl-AMP cyclohydrolase
MTASIVTLSEAKGLAMTETGGGEVKMLKFSDNGLIPAIIQDARDGEVLMLGYMNKESLKRTVSSGDVWFYSRSRQELWHKGETSGNFLKMESIIKDCDSDALLIKAEPTGPVCHLGNRTCFLQNDKDYRFLETEDLI